MQQLNKIVDFYLKSNTNYALMITGDWGIGKTYYFKNILSPLISETATFHNNKKKYRPLLISLFGLKSVEEVQTEIILSLYPILKNKAVKLSLDLGKSLVRGIMRLKGLGDISDSFSDVKIDKGEFIKLESLVICFDDLERRSENFNIEELIGYVNSLVENDNIKILIIANEDKIAEPNYLALKEKVVGNSIKYIPDLSTSYDSLIHIKFEGFNIYTQFLAKNKDFVLEKFNKKYCNLRVLTFALSYYHEIYSKVNENLATLKVFEEKINEILLLILRFVLSISSEYKEGPISYENKKGLDRVGFVDWSTISSENWQLIDKKKETNTSDKSYKDKFIDQYYPDKDYVYFNSVYSFITGGAIFEIDELVSELKKHYGIKDDIILPHHAVFNLLCYPKVFTIAEKEYRKSTIKMLEFSDKGYYDISEYHVIFQFATRFGNPLKFNLDKLESRIIKGMKKGKQNYSYNDSLDFQTSIDNKAEHKKNLLKIKSEALILNNEIEQNLSANQAKRLAKLYCDDFNSFSKESVGSNNYYFYLPIFTLFNVNNVYLHFLRANNLLRWDIIIFWRRRYHNFPVADLKKEVAFLEGLRIKILQKSISLPKNGVTRHIYSEFIKTLDESIEKINLAK